MAEKNTTRMSAMTGLAALLATVHSIRQEYRQLGPDGAGMGQMRKHKSRNRQTKSPMSVRRARRRRQDRTAKASRKVNRRVRSMR